MNKWIGIGRLTAKPELRYNSANIGYTRFNLAVNRAYTNEDGEREADFISCVGWRKTAELLCEHFDKGSQIGIEGHIQTGSYEKENGDKVYTTDIIVDNVTFLDKKKDTRPEPEYTGKIEQQNETDPFAELGEQVSIDDNFLD